MARTEVYSWRVSADLKSALEEAAAKETVSVATLIERFSRQGLQQLLADTDEEQVRLQNLASESFGVLRGRVASRSRGVKETVRARLRRRRAG